MPTRPFTVRERKDAELLIEMAMALDPDDESDEELFDELFAAGAEPFIFVPTLRQRSRQRSRRRQPRRGRPSSAPPAPE